MRFRRKHVYITAIRVEEDTTVHYDPALMILKNEWLIIFDNGRMAKRANADFIAEFEPVDPEAENAFLAAKEQE